MDLKIDFNNPRILQGHLEQALPQADLIEFKKRIVVGSSGGLAYLLFPDRYQSFPLNVSARSISDMNAARDYFDSVNAYIVNAERYANRHGFELVMINDKDVVKSGCDSNSFIYNAGLGSANIKSAEMLGTFLDMVQTGKSQLNAECEKVLKQAGLVTRC